MKQTFLSIIISALLVISFHHANAHCDSKDGPVVAAAMKAIEQNNVNYALIWVKPGHEKEIKSAFLPLCRGGAYAG